MNASAAQVSATALLLRLQGEARRAPNLDALAFLIVDDTRGLIAYRRLALLLPGGGGTPRVRAVSGVSVIDRAAPYVPWVEAAAGAARDQDPETGGLAGAHLVGVEDLPESLRLDWRDMGAPVVWWVPFPDLGNGRDDLLGGGLWIDRDAPPTEAEIVLMESLAESYAHAWMTLSRPARSGVGRKRGGLRKLVRPLALAAGVLALGALALPVPQSALVPARVAPRDPLVVTAPLDGVVAEVVVAPNETVRAGDLLIRYDDTTLKGRLAVAERAVDVAQAELRRAEQSAFGDLEGAGQVALLRARLAKSQAELDLVAGQLARVDVRAERPGVVILDNPEQWVGRPVGTGERILDVADPAKVRLEADLPVDAALVTQPGAPVRLFLDGDPLTPLSGALESVGYRPRMTDQGIAAYRVVAGLDPREADAPPPRIGLTGTARITGERVPLGLYLFRKPIAVLRQRLGV